uniref:Putative secreted protein n=1 Tax=Ixodes ricinus TaxID=34613 RepID=A0A6B0UD67_IXORI
MRFFRSSSSSSAFSRFFLRCMALPASLAAPLYIAILGPSLVFSRRHPITSAAPGKSPVRRDPWHSPVVRCQREPGVPQMQVTTNTNTSESTEHQ